MGELSTQLHKITAGITAREITDPVEDTYGINPCKSLRLTHEITGDVLELPCNGKRCVDCGKRKKLLIRLQLQAALGTNAYIGRVDNIHEVDAALERAKKGLQRRGISFTYQIVGDPTLGWIVASDIQLLPQQRLMSLDAWMDRILDIYHRSVNRIRRSVALGSVSLVRILSVKIKGHRSPWIRRSVESDTVAGLRDTSWAEFEDEMVEKHEHNRS